MIAWTGWSTYRQMDRHSWTDIQAEGQAALRDAKASLVVRISFVAW